MQLRDKVAELILEKLSVFLKRPVAPEELSRGYEALGADSMDMVALAFEIEREFDVKVLPEVFMQYDSIRAAMDAILSAEDAAQPAKEV